MFGWVRLALVAFQLERLRASERTVSRWSRVWALFSGRTLATLATFTNPHWACVAKYGLYPSRIRLKEMTLAL